MVDEHHKNFRKAPWTDDEIDFLMALQNNYHLHPYTCGTNNCRSDLIPTKNGWVCPNCDYTQDWY